MLMEFPVFTMMLYALAGVFFMDICFVILVKNYVPYDSMFIDTGVRNESQKQLWQITMATVIVCPILFLFLLQFTELNTLWLFAISTTPLIIPSWIARQEEKLVRKRDRNFPIYARVLGTAISVRNGGVMSALLSTQVHDFGVLNDMSINLYRRLRLGFNKFKSWFYFGKESGSNLIFHFSRIFSQSVYLGGNATEIGEIISTNLQRILALRKQRWQLIGGLRGVFYGSLFGLVATMYTTITISQMFLGAFDIETEGLTSFVDTILPTADVNYASIMILISILILIHAAMTSWLIKLIDGGPVQASFLDFNLMIWISALLSWTVPMLVRSVLPNLSGVT
jgi:flagellar protein FlaJ